MPGNAAKVRVSERRLVILEGAAVGRVDCQMLRARSAAGNKGVAGVLHSQATRREFLSDPQHRLRFVVLPKHNSWLNQIEVLFGIVMRKVIRRGNFLSVADLEDKLRQFLKDFNETMAHPFHWTHTGKPTSPQRRHPFQPPDRRKRWHPKITLAKLAL